MAPFLTIVTRTCKRPVMLSRNIESVLAQTDKDVEQVFVVDGEQKGVPWANRSLAEAANRVQGEYVYILDDDCQLTERKFVQRLRLQAAKYNEDVIMTRTLRLQLSPCTLPTVWQKPGELRLGTTNALCYVVKRERWTAHIAAFGLPAAGDWHFLSALRDAGCTFGWMDLVVAKTQQLGRGIHFEDCPNDWFKQVARKYHVADLGKGDWRLRLFLQQQKPKPKPTPKRQPPTVPVATEPPPESELQTSAPPIVPQPQPRQPSPHVLLTRRRK